MSQQGLVQKKEGQKRDKEREIHVLWVASRALGSENKSHDDKKKDENTFKNFSEKNFYY